MKLHLTETEIWEKVLEGQERGRVAAAVEPRAVKAWYDADRGLVMFELKNGCIFGFPQRFGEGLEGAPQDEVAAVEVLGDGGGIGWDHLDAHISVPGILFDLLNVRGWYAKWLGSATSEAKAAAARENGKKGGRPRTKAPAPRQTSRRRTTSGE
jgi:hypothetical protein